MHDIHTWEKGRDTVVGRECLGSRLLMEHPSGRESCRRKLAKKKATHGPFVREEKKRSGPTCCLLGLAYFRPALDLKIRPSLDLNLGQKLGLCMGLGPIKTMRDKKDKKQNIKIKIKQK